MHGNFSPSVGVFFRTTWVQSSSVRSPSLMPESTGTRCVVWAHLFRPTSLSHFEHTPNLVCGDRWRLARAFKQVGLLLTIRYDRRV